MLAQTARTAWLMLALFERGWPTLMWPLLGLIVLTVAAGVSLVVVARHLRRDRPACVGERRSSCDRDDPGSLAVGDPVPPAPERERGWSLDLSDDEPVSVEVVPSGRSRARR